MQKGHGLFKQLWKKMKVSLKCIIIIISPYNSMGRVALKSHESIRSADTKNQVWSKHDLKVPSTFRVFMSLSMLSAGSDKEHLIYVQNAMLLAVNGHQVLAPCYLG